LLQPLLKLCHTQVIIGRTMPFFKAGFNSDTSDLEPRAKPGTRNTKSAVNPIAQKPVERKGSKWNLVQHWIWDPGAGSQMGSSSKSVGSMAPCCGKDDAYAPQPGGGGAYASADMPAAAVSKSPRNKAGRQAPPSVADEQPDAALTPTGRRVSETGSQREFRQMNTRRCGTLNLYEALGAGITEKVFNEICGRRKEMGYEEFCDARQKMQGLMQAQPLPRNRVDPLLNTFQRECVSAGVNPDHKHVESLDCRWRRRCSPQSDGGEFGEPSSPTKAPSRPRGPNHLAATTG